MTAHLVKIKLERDLRIVEIPSPPRFDALVKAAAQAYGLRPEDSNKLAFTYKDSDGDEVRFDTDAELDLAIRSSPSPLRVVAQNSRLRDQTSGPRDRDLGSPRGPHGFPHGHVPPFAVDPPIPSTPGYAVASNVDSVLGDDDEDMVMVGAPREVPVASIDAPGKEDVEDIDTRAAFEAETTAARDPEGSELYQKASIRLARRFKVHLTPTQLWRVMALFQIQGRKLVTFGLASHRALDKNADTSTLGEASEVEVSGGERGGVKRSKSYMAQSVVANPVHDLLDLNGVAMAEDEVQPLLEALRVRPRRLVKLGLLPREILAEMPDGHGGPRGGHHDGHIHPHRGHERGGGGRGRGGHGGHGPHPHMHPHRAHEPGPHHHGPGPHPHHRGPPGGHVPPHLRGGGPHGPPPPPPQPRTQGGPHEGAEWFRPPGEMPTPDVSDPYPYMWHGYGGGYGGPPDIMRGGYGWGGWDGHHGHHRHPGHHGRPGRPGHHGHHGHHGGVGGGGPKRGFGKGNKDNMAMARFVAHPTGSDLATVSSGQSFKKSWLVRNDSTTTWPETCCLVPVSHSCQDLSSPPEAPVVGDVAPGEEATVSVDLVAPSQPGMYEGYWRVRDDGQRRFGQRLWAKVMVVGVGEDVNAAVEKLSLDDGHKDN